MTGIFPISKTIESDINKFAPSPSPLPRGERVRERVVTESIYTGTNNALSMSPFVPIGQFKWAAMVSQLVMSATPPLGEDGRDASLLLSYQYIREAQGDVGKMTMPELIHLAENLYTSVNILRSADRSADAYTAYLLGVRVSGQIIELETSNKELAGVYRIQITELQQQADALHDQVQILFQRATEELLRDGYLQRDGGKDDSDIFERLSQVVEDTRKLAIRPPEDEIARVNEEAQFRLQLIAHEKAVLAALENPAIRRSAEVELENLSLKYSSAGLSLRAALFSRAAAEEYLQDKRFMDAIRNARRVLSIMKGASTDPHSERGRAYMVMARALIELGDYEDAAHNAEVAREHFNGDWTFTMQARQVYITALLEENTPRTLAMAKAEFIEMGMGADNFIALVSLRQRF